MADPKKAGEEADRLIAEQNRLRLEAAAAMAAKATAELENPPADGQAISASEETAAPSDVSVRSSEATPVVSPELETLREQVRVSDERWRVLQGMINKKDQEIENMRALLAQLKNTPAQKPEAPVVTQEAVTKQDIEDFGQDMIDLITKVSRNVAAAHFEQMAGKYDSRISELQKTVQGTSEIATNTAAKTFDEALTKRVPNWETVNVDPLFIAWLDETDEFTGAKRMALLQDAYAKMDVVRTAKFFEAFLKETAKPAEQTPPPAPTADVMKLVTPGKSRSAAPTQPTGEVKIWSGADVQKLYSDQRTGKITAEEFQRLERDLFKAQRENRFAA